MTNDFQIDHSNAGMRRQERPIDEQRGPYTEQEICKWLVSRLSIILGVQPDAIQVQTPITSYGLGSIQALTLVADIEDWLGWALEPTLLWDYPTLEEVARFLVEQANAQSNASR
jgi:acyl carrier protein